MAKSQSYDVLAPFYDAVQGDRADHAGYLRSLIVKHHPTATTVLEIACGTGSVLKHLSHDYSVTGVDLSERMLAVAAKKMPRTRLVRQDMTRLHLSEPFDVVLCVYDSINHLLEFEEWEAVFDRAREHLHTGGIFIFDINTAWKLEEIAKQPPWPLWFEDENLMILDVNDRGEDISHWSIRVFEHRKGSEYRLHVEDILERSFPVERVEGSLHQRYRRVWKYDPARSRPTARSERVHFVCRK